MKKRNKLISLVIIGLSVIVLTLSFLFPSIIKKDETTAIRKGAVAEETGARQYDRTEKGGAVYIEAGATYTMKGGTLMNFQKRFGGAVYVASGATFTMESGTITGCSARYGGAIYVESGGYCYINGGSIIGNSATFAPAIYYEDGAILEISDSAIIDNNTYAEYYTPDPIELISTDTVLVGRLSDTFAMHYINFGMFPQTYVGNAMNSTLENWYNEKSPTAVIEYDNRGTSSTMKNQIWYGYSYIDGYIYARGPSCPFGTGSNIIYQDGTQIKTKGTITWFKVEPIKWIITNYDQITAGTATSIECLSYLAISAGIEYAPETDSYANEWFASELRDWLNEEFYASAFSEVQKEQIQTTTLKNNANNGYGTTTEDKVFCKSYDEINQIFSTNNYRVCSPTDYTLSNRCSYNKVIQTAIRPNGGSCDYMLRSAGASATEVCYVAASGGVYDFGSLPGSSNAVRPAMCLNLT